MKKICLMLALIIIILGTPAAALAQQQDDTITRVEFVIELLTQAQVDVEEVSDSSFVDVIHPEIIPYIEAAYKNGIISGYGEYFDPDGGITKEQAVITIVNAFGEKARFRKMSAETMEQALTFTDSADISPWARPYIAYALETGLITVEGDVFQPQAPVSEEQAGEMIGAAKAAYVQMFTKEGMSAADMLVLANKKAAEANTYKQKGTLLTDMELMVEGITPQQIEENQGLKAFLDGGMKMGMQIDMDVSYQYPDKVYIKQTLAADEDIEEAIQDVETFMDGTVMYTRMADADKWVMQDMGSVMEQIMSISDREPYQMAQLSEEELKMFKEFAVYEEDVQIDDKKYYVIGFDIDKDAYMEYYNELVERVMDSIVELQVENPQLQQDPAFDAEQYKRMMTALVANMEVEISYKYYINSNTKFFEKMWVSQDMLMPMEQFMAEVGEMIGEDIPPFSVKVLSRAEGEFEIYDFDVEVDFPVIDEEDIVDTNQPIQTEPETPQED